ncbi:MAG: aldehyde dehydrogenase family protein, partial [Desulfobacterales bacterium]|nr:aldehyde dehydrogenase family protein [Desulfobacterales bacterium]
MKSVNYINGEWVGIEKARAYHVINPATEESLEEIEYGGEAQALEAVTAAHDAFGEWSAKTVYERAGLLQVLALAIRKNQDELARLLTLEVGKP